MIRSIGVLDATSIVGQQFVQLVSDHDSFELSVLTTGGPDDPGADRYADVVNWQLPTPCPVGEMPIVTPDAEGIADDTDIVFSALSTRMARHIEPTLAERGCAVCSNARNDALADDVPLVVPEVNRSHLGLVETQQSRHGWSGMLVKSPAPAVATLAIPLSVLQRYGLEELTVSVLEGGCVPDRAPAGAMETLNNIVPHVESGRSRLTTETKRVLGQFDGDTVSSAATNISASCNRVPVQHGTVANVWATLAEEPDVIAFESGFRDAPTVDVPSAPADSVRLMLATDRPQLRLDASHGGGHQVSVGSVEATAAGARFDCLAHGLVRGAAGNSLLNAELLVQEGYI